jgi:hypothetical protein
MRRHALGALSALLLRAAAAPPRVGPWPTAQASYKVPALDSTDPSMWVHFPVCNVSDCPKFPLIAYVHGAAGGDIDIVGYWNHFSQLASYGFVVAAPDSCDVGCTDKSGGAPWIAESATVAADVQLLGDVPSLHQVPVGKGLHPDVEVPARRALVEPRQVGLPLDLFVDDPAVAVEDASVDVGRVELEEAVPHERLWLLPDRGGKGRVHVLVHEVADLALGITDRRRDRDRT